MLHGSRKELAHQLKIRREETSTSNSFAFKEYRFNTMTADEGLQHVSLKASAPFTLNKLTN
jgi:hypothetical protein